MPPASPIPLCERHLVVAAEWTEAQYGTVDVLPAPCRLCGAREGVRLPSGWLCAVCEWRHGDVIDSELPAPRVEVVYYLRFADRVKIGTSSQPRMRVAAIRHDDLLGFERGGRTLESHRHRQFDVERFGKTEWFALSPRLRDHIAAVAAGVDDPWNRYARWMSEAIALRG